MITPITLSMVIGSATVAVTLAIEAFFIGIAIWGLSETAPRLLRLRVIPRAVITLTALSFWLLAGISVSLWLWAGVLIAIGEFKGLHDAIYFSSVSATTLGYGDVVLSKEWRLLSGFIAANGLFLFSLNTAFLFEAIRRMYDDGA